jgi:hypothetical protein
MIVNDIPPQVSNKLQTCSAQLHCSSRLQHLPEKVNCVRVRYVHKVEKLVTNIQKAIGNTSSSDNLWFRGLNRNALLLSLAFFIPVIANNYDNEFGPGLYAASNLQTAANYCPPGGAVMVFKNPDVRNLKVWEPTYKEWQNLVAYWLKLPLSGITFPNKYKNADIIRRPISTKVTISKKNLRLPEQGPVQLVDVKHFRGLPVLLFLLSAKKYLQSNC